MNEGYRITTIGKIFLAALAGYVIGKKTGYKIRGTSEEIEAVKNALMSSRRFREELEKPGATVESVIDKLKLKQASAREFERILGVPWPL